MCVNINKRFIDNFNNVNINADKIKTFLINFLKGHLVILH